MAGGLSMIVNRALTAAAVLLFTEPVAPALAHDHYGGRGYIRCLECPGNWNGNYLWPYPYWRPQSYLGPPVLMGAPEITLPGPRLEEPTPESHPPTDLAWPPS